MVLNLFRAYKEVQCYTPNQCILTNKCVIFTLSLHKAQASTYELSMDSHWRGMVCSRLVVFCARAWWCLRAFRVVAIPQSGLLAQISSL